MNITLACHLNNIVSGYNFKHVKYHEMKRPYYELVISSSISANFVMGYPYVRPYILSYIFIVLTVLHCFREM